MLTYTNEAMVTFLTSERSEYPPAQGYYFLLKNKSVFRGTRFHLAQDNIQCRPFFGLQNKDMRRLTTGIRSEKYVVVRTS